MKTGTQMLEDLFANVPDPSEPIVKGGGRIGGKPSASRTAAPPPSHKARGMAALKKLAGFIGGSQAALLPDLLAGEEGSFFADKLEELARTVESMPTTKGTEGLPSYEAALAHLRYFAGGQAAWHITEKDIGSPDDAEEKVPPQSQAFGLADLYGDGGEIGYISIAEILSCNGELDFHFTPKSISLIRGGPVTLNDVLVELELKREWASSYWHVTDCDGQTICRERDGHGIWSHFWRKGFVSPASCLNHHEQVTVGAEFVKSMEKLRADVILAPPDEQPGLLEQAEKDVADLGIGAEGASAADLPDEEHEAEGEIREIESHDAEHDPDQPEVSDDNWAAGTLDPET